MRAIDPRKIDCMIAVPGPGKRKAETVWKVETKYRLLRMAARCHFAGLSEREAAAAIAAKIDQYRNRGGWRRDRLEAVCPARHRGKIEEILYALLKVQDAEPSKATICRALASIRAAGKRR